MQVTRIEINFEQLYATRDVTAACCLHTYRYKRSGYWLNQPVASLRVLAIAIGSYIANIKTAVVSLSMY